MDEHNHDKLKQLSIELKNELLEDIVPYWYEHTIDRENGGFIGQVTFQNEPLHDSDKGSILHARIMWTFSAAYKRFGSARMKEMADHAYAYLTDYFWDDEFGGIYWMLISNGAIKDSRKHVYAQAFFIYAMSEYYSAFEKEEALEWAKKMYRLIESHCADHKNGGYFEAYTRDWDLMDDVRLSDLDENEPKSMNTHLHVLEAYTNLYRYWRNADLKSRLESIIELFLNHIITKDRTSLVTFMDEDWTPKSEEISFGHDIEASWLLLEAAEVLGDYDRIEEVREISLSLAHQVMQQGVDEDGGLLNEAGPGGITDDNKDWWPQAEAVVGFMNAYQLSGEKQFMNSTLKSWEFIKNYVLDKKFGEWHEKLTRDRTPHKLDKVRSWKCPYHNGRMVFEGIDRLATITGEKKPGTGQAKNLAKQKID